MENIILNNYVNIFLEKSNEFDYLQNGCFKSEIFILYCLHTHFDSKIFVESGLDFGMSTRILLSLLDCQYIGIDLNPNCGASNIINKNFIFENTNGTDFIPKIVKNNPNQTFSVFIDGPKGVPAINLKNELLKYKNINFVAIHDSYDGILHDNENRIFETMTNNLYYEKYFDLLNQRNNTNISTIFNVQNNNSDKTYFECYPSGPGISIYSKNNVNFIL